MKLQRADDVRRVDARPVLITGGAGFIGTNLAHRLLGAGTPVIVFDNLSRPGVERNLRWLRDTHGRLLRIEVGDIRDRKAVQRVVEHSRQVVHLAAQVAVTTSLLDPALDFDVNARGTVNLLSALHTLDCPPQLLYTSTNKVYGCLDSLPLELQGRRYQPTDPQLRSRGIDELQPLDFHTPYGCSKGAADQYVIDYARAFGIQAVVFRMSCIYGPHQFGTEDQGWVAHFLLRALRGEPITIYGDGHQVRDVLFVDDLVDALLLAFEHIEHTAGQAFNMGGGVTHAVSLRELVAHIGALTGHVPPLRLDDWRPGDQRYYVSDTTRFAELTGWSARTSIPVGLRAMCDWMLSADVASTLPGTPHTVPLQLRRSSMTAARSAATHVTVATAGER